MAILKSYNTEFGVNFHGLDSCGDILYAFKLNLNDMSIINPELLNPNYKDGLFISLLNVCLMNQV